MNTIDLNADLGEGYDTDQALLDLVSSANIACGWHAGDAGTMRDCVRWAAARGVAIGAHPSYLDREHFGRRELELSDQDIYAGVLYQLGALDALARAAGARVAHVKPHGALYNQAAREPRVADAIVAAVRDFDPTLAIYGLAGGGLTAAARGAGLRAIEEAFADRGYRADASLVPRSAPGALIEDEAEVIRRTLDMVRHGTVQAITGESVPLVAHTICLHGDGAHALDFARRLRETLATERITVRAPQTQ